MNDKIKKYKGKRVCILKYLVLEIFDEDYGCEGVPEGQDPLCAVHVRDENGNDSWIRLTDRYLTDNGINEGDNIEI